MTPKQFQKFLDRDKGCYHCGSEATAVPNHRANRGMGGSKERDVPSNIVTLCAELNGLIESDAYAAQLANQFGWKLSSWDDPKEVPVYDTQTNCWFLLGDDFTRNVVRQGRNL